MNFYLLFFSFILWISPFALPATPSLRQNLRQAEIGDYIVVSQNKNFTLLHVADKESQFITIEELNIPQNKKIPGTWKEWMAQGAPSNTSWIFYTINPENAEIFNCYSVSQRQWINIPKQEQFLSKLLNLRLHPILDKERRKVGPPPSGDSPDWRILWQPKMIVEGRVIPNVKFSGWSTIWPNDGSELSGKTIDLYLPEENGKYPSYFPYWLQIRGKVGKATVYIVDSGKGLQSTLVMPKQK